jgi:hypothetical protein
VIIILPRLRLGFAMVVLVISLSALAWSCLPGQRIVLRQKIQPTEMQLPIIGQVVDLPPAIPEMRMLKLEFPPKIFVGDSDVVRLTLEMDENGNLTPTVLAEGNFNRGETIIVPNLYKTHHVLAEARMDMAGANIRPNEIISETLLPGQTITFYWSVLPAEVGQYEGIVWFYLHFMPKTSGIESRQALSAQLLEIEATSFFGLRATPTRWLGIAGTSISSLLGLPFLGSIVKYFWKRSRGG